MFNFQYIWTRDMLRCGNDVQLATRYDHRVSISNTTLRIPTNMRRIMDKIRTIIKSTNTHIYYFPDFVLQVFQQATGHFSSMRRNLGNSRRSSNSRCSRCRRHETRAGGNDRQKQNRYQRENTTDKWRLQHPYEANRADGVAPFTPRVLQRHKDTRTAWRPSTLILNKSPYSLFICVHRADRVRLKQQYRRHDFLEI